MVLAYVTICILQLHVCAPETAVQATPFADETECWQAVSDFMTQHGHAADSAVTLTFRCAGET